MQQMLDQLTSDHRHLEKLLASLDDLHDRTDPLSLDMLHGMMNILHELQHDQVQEHHNLEDQALDLLKSRARISDIMIGVLERDHVRLDTAAANVTNVLKRALNQSFYRQYPEINQHLREFTQAYRNHIRTEEDTIFPMIRRLIAEQNSEFERNQTALSA